MGGEVWPAQVDSNDVARHQRLSFPTEHRLHGELKRCDPARIAAELAERKCHSGRPAAPAKRSGSG